MIRLCLFLLILVVNACGSVNDPVTISPGLDKYVAQANEWSGERIRLPLVRIVFGKVDGGEDVIAQCRDLRLVFPQNRTYGVYKQIIVDPAHWADLDDNSRIMVIMHEEVHCLRGVKAHDKSGLMAPTLNPMLDARATIAEYYATH